MQEIPPQNRKQRRAAARATRRQPAVRRSSLSLSTAPAHSIAGGDLSGEDDMMDSTAETTAADSTPLDFPGLGGFPGLGDFAPADRKGAAGSGRGRPRGSSKATRIRDTLVTYYAFAGMALARVDQYDGELVMAKAVDCADSWMAAGKANPQIMRALEIVTIAGPYTALAMVHLQLGLTIMDHHKVSPLGLFKSSSTPTDGAGPFQGSPPAHQPAPMAYQPAGPSAPTDTKAAPAAPAGADEIRIWPDVELPAEMDVALRQAARQTGRPYDELRQEALVQIAQLRMQQNGHTVQAGALGAPIAAE